MQKEDEDIKQKRPQSPVLFLTFVDLAQPNTSVCHIQSYAVLSVLDICCRKGNGPLHDL